MFFNTTPLRDKILKVIINNPVPCRNTDITNPYLIFSITLFFKKFKTVLLNELYYKGLIDLHGDVDLFIKSKKAADIKYLNIGASLTTKGLSYYKMNVNKTADQDSAYQPDMEPFAPAPRRNKSTLMIVR
ncbi:MAG: hypothetical protein EOP42_00460 [Sphingobacteriaceae bacterium]|nr:MAG: hypothetical protein EOP42_00460 [Sphingobacteriaceae bacterium]